MKRRLFTFALAALTIGLLGSCSKINERIDGLDKRVYDLENAKIASIEQQIAAINQSIADLETIRTNIQNLKNEQEAQGQDITALKAAYITLEGKINDLKAYVDTELAKYATTEWANATFATLEQLKTTNTELGALKETVGNLGETFDGKLADLKTELTNSINTAVSNLETRISTLEARVSALEQMIQSVNITPAYSDGSVEAVDGILTLKCIVSPAEALLGMESLKDSLVLYADSVKVKTKATTPAYMTIEVSEASVLDAAQGAITLKADISEYLPKGEDKALTVAVNIKNGISDFTTEFVPVYVAPKTFKAVYDTNGGANTLTFYYDANDHSGEGITVYEGTGLFNTEETTAQKKWGYNGNRNSIKSVVIDASVAGYKGLTSTAYMFQGMATATNISGAEYLDVSNVTDMSWMFQNFGGGASGNPTTLNSVPDVSGWNTGNVTNMTAMFESYGNFSSSLDKVPDVSNWNTGNVTNMQQLFQKYGHESQNFNAVPDVSKWNTGKVEDMHQMFQEYGHKSTVLNTVPNVSGWNTGNVTNMNQMFYNYGIASTNISCVLDLSGWDLSKITGTNGNNVFNFNPKTFNVKIPHKTGEKSNEGGKWYYGDGTNHIAPPTGKTFTLMVSVTFVNPEGDVISTMPATQSIQKGSKASKPSDPTDKTPGNSGFHTLAGWYKTKDATTGELSDKWDFNNVVTENITLYAQWQTTIEKIIGKAAAPFPFKNIEEDTEHPKYVKDEMTWVGGTDQICYGALYLNTGNKTIFVHGSTRCEGAYYSKNCLKTGIAYKYDGTRAIYTFYIEGGVFTKMVFEAKDPSSTVRYCNGTYTPPTK